MNEIYKKSIKIIILLFIPVVLVTMTGCKINPGEDVKEPYTSSYVNYDYDQDYGMDYDQDDAENV